MPHHHDRRDEERREDRDEERREERNEERREERREQYGGDSPKHGSPKHGHSGHHAPEGYSGYGAPSAGQYGNPSAGQYGAPSAEQYGTPSAGQHGGGYGATYGGPPQNDVNFQNAVHAEAQRMEQDRLANLQNLHRDQEVGLRNERIGEVGALAAGAFALYEGYEARKDPANAKKHMLEAEIAGAAAVAAGGYAVYEHHQQTTIETKVHQLDGTPEKKHGWF